MAEHPLLGALRERRSRRFGLGMKMPAGPLAFASRHPPQPLSEAEEAALAFAAGGITGDAMADLCYTPGGGGPGLPRSAAGEWVPPSLTRPPLSRQQQIESAAFGSIYSYASGTALDATVRMVSSDAEWTGRCRRKVRALACRVANHHSRQGCIKLRDSGGYQD